MNIFNNGIAIVLLVVGLSTEEVTAQSLVFLLGGYETTATTLTFLLYNLAVYPECQEKVVKEINEVFANGVSVVLVKFLTPFCGAEPER